MNLPNNAQPNPDRIARPAAWVDVADVVEPARTDRPRRLTPVEMPSVEVA